MDVEIVTSEFFEVVRFEGRGTAAHPGWVKTDLGTQTAPMEVDEGANTVVDADWNCMPYNRTTSRRLIAAAQNELAQQITAGEAKSWEPLACLEKIANLGEFQNFLRHALFARLSSAVSP